LTTTDKHLEKANSLLDELSREEKAGYKAELTGGLPDGALDGSGPSQPNDSSQGGSKRKAVMDVTKAAPKMEQNEKTLNTKKVSSDIEDNYEEEFEEIDEDLPQDDIEIEGSGDRLQSVAKIGESHGITVSQSLGIDPSVDSLALEDYDHIEPVERCDQ
jgi:hypothetical protein